MRFWYKRVFVSVRRCHDPLREAARIAVGYRHPRPTRSATFNAILSGGAVASYKAAHPAHRQITVGHRIVAAYMAAYVAAPTEATPQVDALVEAKVAIKRKADEGDFERRVRQATGDLRHEADKHLQHANEANQRAVVAVSAAARPETHQGRPMSVHDEKAFRRACEELLLLPGVREDRLPQSLRSYG